MTPPAAASPPKVMRRPSVYRLAPETQFPGAVLDTAATRWASITPGCSIVVKVAVGGDNAGGNLAAVVAQMAWTREFSVALQADLSHADHSREYPSYRRNASGYMLTRAALY